MVYEQQQRGRMAASKKASAKSAKSAGKIRAGKGSAGKKASQVEGGAHPEEQDEDAEIEAAGPPADIAEDEAEGEVEVVAADDDDADDEVDVKEGKAGERKEVKALLDLGR